MTPHGRARLRLALVLALFVGCGAGVGWWATRPAEVRGRELTRQESVGERFDEAFERKSAAPPPRTLDAGPGLMDDAGSTKHPWQEP